MIDSPDGMEKRMVASTIQPAGVARSTAATHSYGKRDVARPKNAVLFNETIKNILRRSPAVASKVNEASGRLLRQGYCHFLGHAFLTDGAPQPLYANYPVLSKYCLCCTVFLV